MAMLNLELQPLTAAMVASANEEAWSKRMGSWMKPVVNISGSTKISVSCFSCGSLSATAMRFFSQSHHTMSRGRMAIFIVEFTFMEYIDNQIS